MTKEQKELVIASLVKFVERVSSKREFGCVSKEEIEILPAISEILLNQLSGKNRNTSGYFRNSLKSAT